MIPNSWEVNCFIFFKDNLLFFSASVSSAALFLSQISEVWCWSEASFVSSQNLSVYLVE